MMFSPAIINAPHTLTERNPYVEDELRMGTTMPGQTSAVGALVGMNARAAGASVAASRRIANDAVTNITKQLSGFQPEFRPMEREDYREQPMDPVNYAQLTFGMMPQSDRLITAADIQAGLSSMPDQGLDTQTGVYHAARARNDAPMNMLAFNQTDVGGVFMQWRDVHENATPAFQRGVEGVRAQDTPGEIVAPENPALLAVAMGISGSVTDTLGSLGIQQRMARDTRGGF